MEVIHPRCAGMDVSKKDAKVCIRVAGAGRRKNRRDGNDVGCDDPADPRVARSLVAKKITCVVMEAHR